MLWVTDRRRDKAQFKAKGTCPSEILSAALSLTVQCWEKAVLDLLFSQPWCQLTRIGTAASLKSAHTGAFLAS